MRNRQLKSTGSPLLGALVNRQVLKADSLAVPFSTEGVVTIDRYSQTKLGVGLGYVYTFVLGKNYFITPLLIAGPEIRIIDYDPINESREIERLRVSPPSTRQISRRRERRHNYASLNFSYLPSIDVTENLDTRLDQTTIELILGHRFGVKD